MNKLCKQDSGVFTVADDAPLFAVPFDKDKVSRRARRTFSMRPNEQRERIKLAGVWSHLDWDDAEAYLERIDNESVPTPPIIQS